MQFTRITIFHVFWLGAVPTCAILAALYGKEQYGWFAAILLGLGGFVASHVAWTVIVGSLLRLNMQRIYRMPTEKLWKFVRQDQWDMNQTLALLTLAARGESVEGELPRIIAMLQSDLVLERVHGWDALRLVFTERATSIEGYDPQEPRNVCQRRVAPLIQESVEVSQS